ncbi:M20/M25/M40 family metallo-hydrolase [Halorussus sp. MSC15.2]|uniref:M20/M25/M40 family metallo-hydrolase n=1 Tax=Halorussus sp. MSC15.2 TaxID=2283638 RepID=UPI0013D4E679|nr:M20/M25/M40 family metallo-hydrolase [Halorussus sp. MSC15.2]NEU57576.1 M20/M25/M40 family metallo-hydrolase [Halorussus sp. MSC15.2]
MSFDPVEFLEAAVQTPSHEDVTEMRDLLVETLESADADCAVEVDDAGNTVAVRDTGREGPHVVLNTHIDTVPPHVEFERVSGADGGGDVVRGRGSCDAKGPLAALLAAFLGPAPERGRVTLAVTPDEETNSTGAAALDFDPVPDAVVVGEPTELDVCNAAKGRFQATVTVRGANAHAAEPQSGVNAVRAAGDLLAALDDFGEREDTPDPSEQLGAPTLTPTTIEGGTATNQVPAECSFVVDRRSVPPETAEGFRAALAEHLRERAPAEVGVEVALAERDTPFLAAFETPEDDPVVRALREASGGAVRPFGAATEASYFAQVAPTVVFGPGSLADDEGAVAHAPREYVRLTEVERAGEAVEAALADICS